MDNLLIFGTLIFCFHFLDLVCTTIFDTRKFENNGCKRVIIFGTSVLILALVAFIGMKNAASCVRYEVMPVLAMYVRDWHLDSPAHYHIEAETKWPPFPRRHFQMDFLWMKMYIMQRNGKVVRMTALAVTTKLDRFPRRLQLIVNQFV